MWCVYAWVRGWVDVGGSGEKRGDRWSQIDRLRSGSAQAERTQLCFCVPTRQCTMWEAGGSFAQHVSSEGGNSNATFHTAPTILSDSTRNYAGRILETSRNLVELLAKESQDDSPDHSVSWNWKFASPLNAAQVKPYVVGSEWARVSKPPLHSAGQELPPSSSGDVSVLSILARLPRDTGRVRKHHLPGHRDQFVDHLTTYSSRTCAERWTLTKCIHCSLR